METIHKVPKLGLRRDYWPRCTGWRLAGPASASGGPAVPTQEFSFAARRVRLFFVSAGAPAAEGEVGGLRDAAHGARSRLSIHLGRASVLALSKYCNYPIQNLDATTI